MFTKSSNNRFAILEQKLGYQFCNIDLLVAALTHPSMKQVDDSVEDYERLEFLGDSILGFIITDIVFHQYHQYNEGSLAKIKSYAISSSVLAEVASNINLSKWLIMAPGEESSGGRDNSNNIANAMEAVLAAIYIDGNIIQVKKIVRRLWYKWLDNINFSQVDPKSYLQELLQKKKLECPEYVLISKVGLDHQPSFTIKVISGNKSQIGTGKSIKEAEKNAAKNLINVLNAENHHAL